MWPLAAVIFTCHVQVIEANTILMDGPPQPVRSRPASGGGHSGAPADGASLAFVNGSDWGTTEDPGRGRPELLTHLVWHSCEANPAALPLERAQQTRRRCTAGGA